MAVPTPGVRAPPIRRVQGGPARRQDVHLRQGRRAQPVHQPPVSRHHTHQRRRRTRSAPQARRPPDASARTAGHQRQRRRQAAEVVDRRGGPGRGRRRRRSGLRATAGGGSRPRRLAARRARQSAAMGRSHIRHPRPAQQAGRQGDPASLQMLRFARRVVRTRSMLEGSMAHEISDRRRRRASSPTPSAPR